MATIILTLDGSAFAEQAIPHALGRLTAGDELLLVQVVDPAPTLIAPETFMAEIDLSDCQDYLDKMVRRLRDRGLKVRGSLTVGPPRDTLVSVAAHEKASLIVMSTHGRTGMKRWLLGSVAESVARHAPCPVWLVRCSEPEGFLLREPWNEEAASFRRVLVPLDTSEQADEAINFVTRSLDKQATSVILLAATNLAWLGQVDICGQILADMRQQLETRAQRLRESGWDVEVILDPGAPAAAILDNAVALHADLIVITSHGRSGGGRWFLGSVAEKTVRHAGCPVVIVRQATELAAPAEPAAAGGGTHAPD